MMKLHLEKIEKVEQVKCSPQLTIVFKSMIFDPIQGGRLLGLPGGGAGAFPLPDQVVQRGHRSDGETFQNKDDAKSSRDLFQFPCPDGSTGAACPRNEQDANVLYDNKMLGVPRWFKVKVKVT